MTSNFVTKHLEVYEALYTKYGYSVKSLGWDKGKQFLRFHQLTSDWNLSGARILDVGCGFGDFVGYLEVLGVEDFSYLGIDLLNSFVSEGRSRYGRKDVKFSCGDFLAADFSTEFDFVISSGIFNLKVDGVDGYSRIQQTLSKMFSLSRQATSADFLSDKLDYLHPRNFASSPEKILAMAYSLSRNVTLKNTYFPFEFSVTIYKDDSFRKETTVFPQVQNLFGQSGDILR